MHQSQKFLLTSFEARDETINGNSASVYIKNRFGVWEKFFFVKEGDGWKLDIIHDPAEQD